METDNISGIYKNVCEQTSSDGFHIEHMPDFFDTDAMDNSKSHVHTFYEIIWFQDEGGVHTVDFKDYEIKANSFFFLSPGQVHHFDGATRHKGVLIKFCTDFLRNEIADEDIFLKYNVFNAFDKAPFRIVSDNGTILQLSHLVALMEQEENLFSKGGNDFAHMDMLRALVRIFLISIYRHGEHNGENALSSSKQSHKVFVRFRQQLESHYSDFHTVKEYSDILNVSQKTLSNSVIECSGKSPLKFINDRIILEAKRLLRFTDLMVKEVSYRLGYEDPSYFVKFFKRQTGILPSELREPAKSKSLTRLIAVPARDGMVDSHFGHCEYYTIFHVNERNRIIRSERLDSPQGCGCKSNIASVLSQMGVSVMLAGNMGDGAYKVLSSNGIEVVRGCAGKARTVLRSYLAGKLSDSKERCLHHDCAEEKDHVFRIDI